MVILSVTWNAPLVLDGGVPTAFPWPVFAAGLAFAAWDATTALQRVPPRPGGRTGR